MSIPAEEVAEVFRRAIRGEIAVKLLGDEAWNDVFCGDVEFMFGDWHITVFNDVLEFDYVDNVKAPDGRTAEYDDWFHSGAGDDPVDLLAPSELSALEDLVDRLAPTPYGAKAA
ncbi:DUF7693 family protein [Paraburkholderia atlantica]|uniref:DUF7693 family protein n=1 Tax=Paraburkholderia atlantica TaxID=2654982 RepID=UPI001615CBC3|nr:hypothetical protein [Paraburkholderia atlantica]MBB5414039.1 hypothetical protein [Paraburkholderia atlantica]